MDLTKFLGLKSLKNFLGLKNFFLGLKTGFLRQKNGF